MKIICAIKHGIGKNARTIFAKCSVPGSATNRDRNLQGNSKELAALSLKIKSIRRANSNRFGLRKENSLIYKFATFWWISDLQGKVPR